MNKKILILDDLFTFGPYGRFHYKTSELAQKAGDYQNIVENAKKNQEKFSINGNGLEKKSFISDYITNFLQDVSEDQKIVYGFANLTKYLGLLSKKILESGDSRASFNTTGLKFLGLDLLHSLMYEPRHQKSIEKTFSNRFSKIYKERTGENVEIDVANSASSALKKISDNDYEFVLSDLGMAPLERLKTSEDLEVEENYKKLSDNFSGHLCNKYLGVSFLDKLKGKDVPYSVVTSGHGLHEGLPLAVSSNIIDNADFQKIKDIVESTQENDFSHYNENFENIGNIYFMNKNDDQEAYENWFKVIRDTIKKQN